MAQVVAFMNGWPEDAIRYFDGEILTRDQRLDSTVEDASQGGVYAFLGLREGPMC